MSHDLKAALAELTDLDHAALKKRWAELHGKEAPLGMSRPLLRHAIAYHLQERALGGIHPVTRRALKRMLEEGQPAIRPASMLRPGTRLLRAWHGVTYEVIVLDHGVMFEGQRYRSLSEVARVITGAKWSGPSFFGLRKKTHG